jgi:hypothetical protein
MPVKLHSPGKRAPLGFTVPRKDFDFMAPIPPGTRFIPDKGRIIDLEKGVSIQLPDGERVAEVEGARVLVARENELLWRDMDTGEERRFPAPRETRLPTRRAGPWIATRGLVINVSTGALLGRYTGSPLALGYDGRLLYDPGQPRHYGQLPRGPLWWQAPLQ